MRKTQCLCVVCVSQWPLAITNTHHYCNNEWSNLYQVHIFSHVLDPTGSKRKEGRIWLALKSTAVSKINFSEMCQGMSSAFYFSTNQVASLRRFNSCVLLVAPTVKLVPNPGNKEDKETQVCFQTFHSFQNSSPTGHLNRTWTYGEE